jgi:hypothetical protein
MSGLIIFLVIFAALAIFDVLAQTHGVDSRWESDFTGAAATGIYT